MFNQNITPTDFRELADKILNGIIINANNNLFRICEIEMYLRNEEHPDEYVHKHKDQLEYEKFYFHKFHNGTYKSGTFKGLDITIGNANTNTYFGILIRSIQHIKSGEFIEGSCKCVNKILEQYNGVKTVKELFNIFFPNISQIDIYNDMLKLEYKPNELEKQNIYSGPRVGLSDKFPEYKNKPYRFAIMKCNIKKMKKTLL